MAVMAHSTLRPSPLRHADSDSNLVNTFADRQFRSTSATAALGVSGTDLPSAATDMNKEIAALSDKLIKAINHQTDLDDTLATTRDELQDTRERLQKADEQVKQHEEMLENGKLWKEDDVQAKLSGMVKELNDERAKRVSADKEKRRLQTEVETLTTALFEEANEMVANARHDTERVDRRNEQLKGQLEDMELLLTSHQAQLAQLKQVIEQLNEEHQVEVARLSAPSTPQLVGRDFKRDFRKMSDAPALPPRNGSSLEIHRRQHSGDARLMLRPAFRSNIAAHHEFTNLFTTSNASRPNTRPASATFQGLNISGTHGSSLPVSHSPHPAPQLHSNHSNSSINSDVASPSTTPTTPVSVSGQFSPKPTFTFVPLKDFIFYKRILAEDVEPTLRLDLSPGLSWLNRRSVLNAVADGNLVVEPVPPGYKHHQGPCAMCGEDTRNLSANRRYQFRSNRETKKRYPACDYCIGRLRSTCDFLGFLRMIREGHWKSDRTDSERVAWEECVRLREVMFWARVGREDSIAGIDGIKEEDEPADKSEASISGSSTESLAPPKASIESERRRSPISQEIRSDELPIETLPEEAGKDKDPQPSTPPHSDPSAEEPRPTDSAPDRPTTPDQRPELEREDSVIHHASPVKDLDYERVSEESKDWTDESDKRHSFDKLGASEQELGIGAAIRSLRSRDEDDGESENWASPKGSMPGTPRHEVPGAFIMAQESLY